MKSTAYLIQATLISLWWTGLFLNQNFYNAFSFPGIEKTAFYSFFLPDVLIIAVLSVVNAYSNKKALKYIILGAFSFATLYCINASILTSGGYLSTTIMILGFCYNMFLVNDEILFKKSSTSNNVINATKTILQIICIWLITLFVIPAIIIKSFNLTVPKSESFSLIPVILFIAFSCLGLISAYIMVKIGKGTPLPLDQTQNLVTKGPYKYVRNPMAIAGIGQGLSIGIMINSIHILLYSLVGAVLWHYVVRPIEEHDMLNRFGNEYLDYTKSVKCWIPTFVGKTKN